MFCFCVLSISNYLQKLFDHIHKLLAIKCWFWWYALYLHVTAIRLIILIVVVVLVVVIIVLIVTDVNVIIDWLRVVGRLWRAVFLAKYLNLQNHHWTEQIFNTNKQADCNNFNDRSSIVFYPFYPFPHPFTLHLIIYSTLPSAPSALNQLIATTIRKLYSLSLRCAFFFIIVTGLRLG